MWDGAPTSFTMRFFAGGVHITGSQNLTQLLTDAEEGVGITFGVIAYNANGDASGEVISDPTDPVDPATPPLPTNTVAPVISGVGAVGETLTLTSLGTWTDADDFTEQWRDPDLDIVDADGLTHVVPSNELGKDVLCRVRGISINGEVAASSNVITIGLTADSTRVTVDNTAAVPDVAGGIRDEFIAINARLAAAAGVRGMTL